MCGVLLLKQSPAWLTYGCLGPFAAPHSRSFVYFSSRWHDFKSALHKRGIGFAPAVRQA
jgi:hypothetical protein